MSRLAPNLFARRFDDLVESARSRLPGLAPAWTDHNLHDPGITFIELLAWVAEAQLYSIGRTRRDERVAYAALLGLTPRGPEPARGLLWPDRADPSSPSATYQQSFTLEAGAAVHTAKAERPAFATTQKLLWVAGRVRAVQTRLAAGGRVDHTASNARGNVAYFPFGEAAGPRDVLRMEIECGETGLFPRERGDADGARLTIGVRADAQAAGGAGEAQSKCECAVLAVALVTADSRFPLEVVADSSRGFAQTGALVLDVSAVEGSPSRFTLEFHAPGGFERPPRVLRIEPNVLPIAQGSTIDREVHVASGLPDQRIELDVPGLRFGAGAEPVKVEVADTGRFVEWTQRDLADCGPEDLAYGLDAAAGAIRFGNGLNGRIPAAGAQVFITYAVCDGAGGNTARAQRWIVRGVSGVFGVNPDPVAGGSEAFDDGERRREARRRAREAHALVTPADIEAAAMALPALEVARARVLAPDGGARDGALTLIAMRAGAAGGSGAAPESRRWLRAVERRIAQRMPLGSGLRVVAPRYVDFALSARVEAAPSRDPDVIAAEVRKALEARLEVLPSGGGKAARDFGAGVTRRDLVAWIRAVPGVQRILDLRLEVPPGSAGDEVKVPRRGLPRLDVSRTSIEVVRPAARRSP